MTWAALILVGGVVGAFFGWAISPFSHIQQSDAQFMIVAWLHYPETYWPYVAAGAVTFGLAYYGADLLTGSR